MNSALIDTHDLLDHLGETGWVIVDCRFNLDETEAGRRAYREGHIPGAVYAHLDDDLSGAPVTDAGRHPLPTPEQLNERFRRMGIDHDSQVVAYDGAGGMIAARLWWMLRYMGHDGAAVLNGGWQAWEAAGYPVVTGDERNEMGDFSGEPRREWLVRLDEVTRQPLLVDSRAPERYRGEVEKRDPRAGHIPGAVPYHFARNLDEDGAFLPRAKVRQQLLNLMGSREPASTTFYCGSGVSACVNLLALEYAGLPAGKLYVGSWSEWSADPDRPAATGDAPSG